jgi:hypothetical protein
MSFLIALKILVAASQLSSWFKASTSSFHDRPGITTSRGNGANTGAAAATAAASAIAARTYGNKNILGHGGRIPCAVPNSWVVEDINSTDLSQQFLSQYGVEYLAVMCPGNQALPVIGGLHSCPLRSPTAVGVELFRFVDLHTRSELVALARQNKSITTSDLLALFIEDIRKIQDPQLLQNLQIVNN